MGPCHIVMFPVGFGDGIALVGPDQAQKEGLLLRFQAPKDQAAVSQRG